MPNLGAKFSSSYITAEVMLEFIAQLPSKLRQILSSPNLTVSYGWGCSHLQILLCHESDIHIDGTDNETIAKLVESFPNIDFRSANDWKSHYDNQRTIGIPPNVG